ncbi:unnamed protein product [Pedinophyceae sp. YPF-701]|nr:unnamed protein product [Pedinophyceae sp. YPF-701]
MLPADLALVIQGLELNNLSPKSLDLVRRKCNSCDCANPCPGNLILELFVLATQRPRLFLRVLELFAHFGEDLESLPRGLLRPGAVLSQGLLQGNLVLLRDLKPSLDVFRSGRSQPQRSRVLAGRCQLCTEDSGLLTFFLQLNLHAGEILARLGICCCPGVVLSLVPAPRLRDMIGRYMKGLRQSICPVRFCGVPSPCAPRSNGRWMHRRRLERRHGTF